MQKRIQNKVAESRFAFPVVAVYGLLVWLAAGAIENMQWMQFAMYAVSTVLMLTLNNSNALIRIYSRMVSCSFIVMACSATFLFQSLKVEAVQMLFVLFYLSLLRSYQDKRAPGIVFYSFACIGLISLWFVQILYFVPVFWLLMATNLMAFGNRMFWASILGIIVPYWFMAGYYLYMGNIDDLQSHFLQLVDFQPLFGIEIPDMHRLATFAVVALLAVIGIVHYLRNSYLDKIRTRMIFEMFITVDLLAMAFLVLQPQHFDMLMPIVIVNTSCLYAHFIALTKTRITNIVFLLVCVLMLALTVFNVVF